MKRGIAVGAAALVVVLVFLIGRRQCGDDHNAKAAHTTAATAGKASRTTSTRQHVAGSPVASRG